MALRLSDISSKTGKKCIFCVFRPFLSLCRTASRPYKLSHLNALRINQSYTSKDESQKFSQKNIENWRSPENDFCLVFWLLGCSKKINNNCIISMKTSSRSYEVSFISALWMVSSESWKRLHPNTTVNQNFDLLALNPNFDPFEANLT